MTDEDEDRIQELARQISDELKRALKARGEVLAIRVDGDGWTVHAIKRAEG